MLVLLVVNFDHTDRCSSLPCLLMDTLTLWRWRRLASRNSCAREQNLSILLTSNLTIFSLSLAVSRWETSQRVPTSPSRHDIYYRQAEHVLVTKAPARLPQKTKSTAVHSLCKYGSYSREEPTRRWDHRSLAAGWWIPCLTQVPVLRLLSTDLLSHHLSYLSGGHVTKIYGVQFSSKMKERATIIREQR